MKKHMVAAAVAAAIAVPAAAQVTVYGRFDQAYLQQKVKDSRRTAQGDTLKTTNSGLDGGVGGSRLGFRGSEDLGGGMKANFVYEFGVDAGDNVGVGSTRLGFADIQGGFGTIRYGRQVSATKAIADSFNASGNNTNFAPGDVNGSSQLNMDVRLSNAITYISPTMNGFSFSLQYAKNEDEAYTCVDNASSSATATASTTCSITGRSTFSPPMANANSNASGYVSDLVTTTFGAQQGEVEGASLNYAQGPLAIGIAVLNQKAKNFTTFTLAGVNDSSVTDADDAGYYYTWTIVPQYKDERTLIGASYDFGMAKLHLEHGTREVKSAATKTSDWTISTVGVTLPLGNIVLTGQYSDGKNEPGGTTANTNIEGYKLRAAYNFSKRTSVYGTVGETETEQSTTRIKRTGSAIGLIHTF